MATATFRVEDFAAELEAAPTNYEIATRLLFENERMRVCETEAIHDLENTGETTARFTTVELLG